MRAQREPEVNSIEARRRPKKAPPPPGEPPRVEPEARAPAAAPSGVSDRISADSDPWTVPESIRDRFSKMKGVEVTTGTISFDAKGQTSDLSVVHFVETQKDLSWKALSWQ